MHTDSPIAAWLAGCSWNACLEYTQGDKAEALDRFEGVIQKAEIRLEKSRSAGMDPESLMRSRFVLAELEGIAENVRQSLGVAA